MLNKSIRELQQGKAPDFAADRIKRKDIDGSHGASAQRSYKWLNSDLKARDLMRTCETTLRPEDSIKRAARLMNETENGAIPVVDEEGHLIGILTARDITIRLIALGASIPHTQVSDCMTAEVFACSENNSLESCVSAMCWHQVKRIPIVDDEHRVLGIINQRDLAQYLCEHSERVEPEEMVDVLWALAS
jgi:CBS domain-containing protein